MEPIPLLDLRELSFGELTKQHKLRGLALLASTRRCFGWASFLASIALLPLGDFLARRWLVLTENPFLAEIDEAAETLGVPGIHALNLSYEWGCTSGIFAGETPRLLRVLDWPFPGLGENVVVVRQRGKAGEFYNVTWPGMSGSFQAMAPGRFCVALNQAPMRRHGRLYVGDWFKNRLLAYRERGIPPAHLVRQVCEGAVSYEAAKEQLSHTPVSIPVIYILSGVTPGEGCIIERTENGFAVHELAAKRAIVAANHFIGPLDHGAKAWTARPVKSLDRATFLEAAELDTLDHFGWLSGPVSNIYTRLAMSADAATGRMRVVGIYGKKPVTQIFVLD